MFIYNFFRGFFTVKVVENSPQNARNCAIFKIFLGGACPQTPLAKARSCELATCRFAACISKIPEILKLGPPVRNPAYAPAIACIKLPSNNSCPVLTAPRILSGLLTTADSATEGCSNSALSTSNGPIR